MSAIEAFILASVTLGIGVGLLAYFIQGKILEGKK